MDFFSLNVRSVCHLVIISNQTHGATLKLLLSSVPGYNWKVMRNGRNYCLECKACVCNCLELSWWWHSLDRVITFFCVKPHKKGTRALCSCVHFNVFYCPAIRDKKVAERNRNNARWAWDIKTLNSAWPAFSILLDIKYSSTSPLSVTSTTLIFKDFPFLQQQQQQQQW